MLNESNLKNFESLVVSEAEKERNEVLDGLKAQLEEKMSEYKKQADAKLNERLNHEIGKIESRANERVAEKSLEGKKQYLELRETRINHVFEKVTESLREFVKTDDYVSDMKSKIEGVISENDSDFTIVVGANDGKLADFVKNAGYNSEISHKSFIGGCKIINNKEKTLVDITYASLLENESEGFLEKYFKI